MAVYFIQDDTRHFIKIGKADNPIERIADLQTGSPAKLVLLTVLPGGRAEETKLHQRFAEYREHGEWFRPGPKLLLFLLEHGSMPPFEGVSLGLPYLMMLCQRIISSLAGGRDVSITLNAPCDGSLEDIHALLDSPVSSPGKQEEIWCPECNADLLDCGPEVWSCRNCGHKQARSATAEVHDK